MQFDILKISARAQILLGVSVVLAWKAGFAPGLTWGSEASPMQMNTAICIVALGCLVLRWSWPVAALVVVLAGGALIESWLSTQLLDEMFQAHYIDTATSEPGRMAPNTSLLALLQCLATRLYSGRWHTSSHIVHGFIGSTAMISIMGYLSSWSGAYQWHPTVTAMALPTAVGFLLVPAAVAVLSVQE